MRFARRRAATLLAWSAAAAGSTGGCTFPDFVVPRADAGAPSVGASAGTADTGGMANVAGAASQSGNGGVGGQIGGGGSGASAGSDGGSGGSAGANTAGTSGSAGSGGDSVGPDPPEFGPCGARAHSKHCSNHQLDVGETDIDCGGPSCLPCAGDESCAADRDCATGACLSDKCARLLSLKYMQENSDQETPSLDFDAVLAYTGKNPILLRDLTLRYYFSRNSVTEPILPTGSTAQLPDGGEISDSTRWNIVRLLRGDGVTNDAYLEISFIGGKILSTGDSLDMLASAATGDGVSLFNQKTHHSYEPDTTLHESKKLAIYYKNQRVWGNGPAVDDPPACFKLGVNLDGPALTVGSDPWRISPDSVLARYINLSIALNPDTDKGRADMLRSGFFFHDETFSYPVDSGKYALLAYVWSEDGAETGTLKVQDTVLDTFQATSFAGGGPWVALGPYRVTVANAQLKLAAVGDLRVGGIELRVLDE
jgi:hypothetical protein